MIQLFLVVLKVLLNDSWRFFGEVGESASQTRCLVLFSLRNTCCNTRRFLRFLRSDTLGDEFLLAFEAFLLQQVIFLRE